MKLKKNFLDELRRKLNIDYSIVFDGEINWVFLIDPIEGEPILFGSLE